MKEFYGYFDSIDDDIREYNASEFTHLFRASLSNGITAHNGGGLIVSPSTGMQTIISPGGCLINGYLYVLEDDGGAGKTFTHSPSGSADRIDRIVCRLNVGTYERHMSLAVLEGTPSANPAPPALTRDDQIYELSICQVRIRASVTSLLATDITSERNDSQNGGTAFPIFSYSQAQGAALTSSVSQIQTSVGSAVQTSAVANNVTTTAAGLVLDARQGKTLSDRITTAQSAANTAQSTATTAQSTANGKAATFTSTATFTAAGWSAAVPYTQAVSVAGLLATDNPVVDILSLSGDVNTAKAQLESFGCLGQMITGAGTLTAYCYNDKPTANFSIQCKVVR